MMEAESWHNWKGTATHLQTQLIPEQYQLPPFSPKNFTIINVIVIRGKDSGLYNSKIEQRHLEIKQN